MSELKPCPFCGGSAELCHESFGYVSVRCGLCRFIFPARGSVEKAIRAWNTRMFTKADVEAAARAIPSSASFQPLSMPWEKRAYQLAHAALSALGEVENGD
jgi:Lar family restriction alleviation protein